MMDSGVYDSSGNLKNGTQADLYQKGLENQSRIGMNKTIGVGKEDLSGQAGVDKMNAIQYGAQAGVQGEIAQGQSLKNVYGTDLKGTKQSRGLSYSQTAEINATRSNLDSAAMAAGTADLMGSDSPNEAYMEKYFKAGEALASKQMAEKVGQGESAKDQINKRGGGKKGLEKLEKTARSNANKQTDEAVGSAEGYDDITKGYDSIDEKGNKVHHDADPKAFETSAKISTQAQGAGTRKKIEAQKENMKSKNYDSQANLNAQTEETAKNKLESLQKEMDAEVQKRNQDDFKKFKEAYDPERFQLSLSDNGELSVKSLKPNQGFLGAGLSEEKVMQSIKGDWNKHYRDWNKDQVQKEYQGEIDKINEEKLQSIGNNTMKTFQNANNIENASESLLASAVSDTLAANESLNFSQISSNVGSAKNLGILNQKGNITNSGVQMHDVMASSRFGDMMAQKNAWSNTGNQQRMIDDLIGMGASREEVEGLKKLKGNASAFAAEYKSKFGVVNINSMINGRRTAKSMSAAGGALEGGMFKGEHYSINTRTSLTGGYTSNMGEAYSAMAATTGNKIGGIDGQEKALKTFGTIKTAYEGVMDTADVITNLTPVGRVGKAVKATKSWKRPKTTEGGTPAEGGSTSGAKGDG